MTTHRSLKTSRRRPRANGLPSKGRRTGRSRFTIVPFIEGDGIGRDIWKASCACSMRPLKTYGGKRKIQWFGSLPAKGQRQIARHLAARRAPTARPSSTTASRSKALLPRPSAAAFCQPEQPLRQIHDLYSCVRPVFDKASTTYQPDEESGDVNIVIFRGTPKTILLRC